MLAALEELTNVLREIAHHVTLTLNQHRCTIISQICRIVVIAVIVFLHTISYLLECNATIHNYDVCICLK